MKKIYLLLITMLTVLSITSNAQLNYLFSATTKAYVPVTNGINPHLTTNGANHELADEGLATIPIGFAFKYNNENYSNANVNVNGFITLGNPPEGYWLYWLNDLSSGPYGTFYQRPVIAPLWDDLYLVDTANLVYKTTGSAPFRVFTIEWKYAKWSYDALTPALSIEVKLYETTNLIEFHYKDEGGIPDQYAYASIGITSSVEHRDFISLQSTSSHPGISLVKEMDSIHIKPANNQVYRFTPALLNPPANFRKNYSYTNKSVSLQLESGGFNGFEYAVTRSPIAPSSGTTTSSSNVTVASLSSATTYYVYARSQAFNFLHSQWVCDSFTTQVKPVSVPYMLNTTQINPVTNVPDDVRTQDFRDTSIYYSGQFSWYGGTDFPNPGDNYIYYTKVPGYLDDDAWMFTRGMRLTGGKTYRLKFSYLTFYYYNPGELASLEVKYGTGDGFGGMNSGSLFKDEKIDSNDPIKDTTIEFSPASSDVYYFGFHDFTERNGGSPIIVNVSLEEKPAGIPIALSGKASNKDNILKWVINEPGDISNLELQRSADGVNFVKIVGVDAKIKYPGNTRASNATFRIQPETIRLLNFPMNIRINSKRSVEKFLATNQTGFQMHPRIERINPDEAISGLPSLNAKPDLLPSKEYVDHDAKGINYYRLQQTGKNGKLEYSNTVKLGLSELGEIYPVPAKDILNIKFDLLHSDNIAIQVSNISGKVLINKTVESFQKINIVQLDISHLSAGTYFIKLISAGGVELSVQKFVKI